MVNVTDKQMDTNIAIENAGNLQPKAAVSQIKADSMNVFNSKTVNDLIKIEESETEVSANFTYSLPKFSVTVLTIHQK